MLDTPKAGQKTLNHRSDWRTARLKFLFKRQTRTVLEPDEVITAFRDGTVTLRKNRREDGFTFAELEIGYQGIEPGDLVIHAMDGFAGAIGVSDSRGKGSPVLSIVTPRSDAEPRFWAYYLRNLAITGFIQSLAKGIRERSTDFRWKDASNLLVNFPDLATQRQIADFLDRETARIDLLIEKKQKLVALLGEKYVATAALLSTGKQSYISMIHSGLDWLGSIPKSWRVEKLSWHFYAAKGKDAQKYTKEYCGANEGEFPVYSGQTADEGVMGRIDTFDYDFGETGVLFATTVGAKAMHLRHLKGKFSLSQNCMIIIPRKNLPLRFFLYQMRVLFRKERQMIPDHMQASFRVDDLYQYRIAVPPLNEAVEIGLAIEKAEAALMAVSQPVYSSIARLKEYRSALITAAVTGQIDVENYTKSGATEHALDAVEEVFS